MTILQHHLGAPPPFNMFATENRNNSNGSPNNHNMWHGEMMGMNAAVAKAALAMPPFGPPNMQFGKCIILYYKYHDNVNWVNALNGN